MIWQYFPIGLRFPVKDFSDETKRVCWETALSALYACDPNEVKLYDAQETYDYGSGSPVYLCILCFYGIKQSRECGKRLMELDRLTSRLCRHQPFLQANALESFGPYPLLGKTESDGSITVTETGTPLLSNLTPKPMQQASGIRLMIVSDESEREGEAESHLRFLGTYAADLGFLVRRMLISSGSDFLRMLVTEKKGRFDHITMIGENGERQIETIGVLPHATAAMQASGADEESYFEHVQKVIDLGYRRICFGVRTRADAERVRSVLQRFENIEDTVIEGASAALHTIDFETAARQSDFVILHAYDADGDTARNVLSELNAVMKPTCLLTQKAIDAKRLMQEHIVLRGVIETGEAAEPDRAGLDEVLSMIGKDIAKTQQI